MPGDYLNWRTSWCAVSNWRQTCLGMTFGRLLILMREKKKPGDCQWSSFPHYH